MAGCLLGTLFLAAGAPAQTNGVAVANSTVVFSVAATGDSPLTYQWYASNAAPGAVVSASNVALAPRLNGLELEEKLRAECVAGRRSICGRIVKILPGGLVVDSGYPSLQRLPLTRSWLVPGTVVAQRDPTLVESREPGAMCVGQVYVTDLPKSRGAKPKPYDYVIIEAFPAGDYTYQSVGDVHHTVRHFAAVLEKAVRVKWDAAVAAMDANAKTK